MLNIGNVNSLIFGDTALTRLSSHASHEGFTVLIVQNNHRFQIVINTKNEVTVNINQCWVATVLYYTILDVICFMY